MKKLLTLIRAGLKSNFGLALLRHRLFKEKKDRWMVPLFAVAFAGVLPSLYGLVLFIKNIYLALKPLGQERALLTMGILSGQFFILLFGLYYVISAFYFSRDLEFLIPLPLKPFQVMASKFAVILVNEYLTVLVIVVPVLIGYGVLARAALPYWANALLVYLFLPVIPLAVVSILVVAMMRFINLSRKKDALILVGSIILIAASLGLQFILGRSSGPKPDARAMTAFFTSPDSLLNQIGAKFPPSIWATKAIDGGFSGEGLWNLFLFLATSLLFFAFILVLSEKLFYRGLVGLGEVSGRKRLLSRAQMSERVSSGRRPVKAIFAREWRVMNRTPIFLLNGVLVVVIVPIVFILMATMGSRGGDSAAILKIMTSANTLYVTLAVAAFMTSCGSLNGTASSTFSREGGQFWISRVIPVAPRDQVTAKFLHSYLVSGLGVVTASIVSVLILHLKAGVLAVAAALALVAGVLLTAVGMVIDLARPLLDWTNPQKAIKQNLNVLFATFADIGILTGLFFLLRFLIKAGVAGGMVLAVLFAALVGLSLGSLWFLFRFAEKRYREIEV
jgi:ABC-2 type transport system permease protein